ncbi:MAG: hypothetical protein AAF696_29565 [Bacteroidota bacterium]
MSLAQKYRPSKYLETVYNHSPLFVQNLIYSGFGFIKMREFKKLQEYVKELEAEERLSRDEIAHKQLKKFKKLFQHAKENTAYYAKIFREHDLNVDSFRSIEDLKQIPLLDKPLVIRNYQDLIASNYQDFEPVNQSSGGTTGTTLKFMMDKDAYMKKEAEVIHYWNRHGYRPGEKKSIMYRAGVIIPPGKEIKKPWRYDYARKMLYLSSYYASEKLFADYVKVVNTWQPEIMNGLPSAIYLFADYLNRKQITLPLEKIMTASEMLHSFQREAIEKAFQCKAYDHSGHGEPGMYAAGQCSEGHYHIPTNNVIVEVSEDGYLIETSLNNYSIPFIRYKVGDLIDGIYYNCSCGINTPYFKKIYGRESSLVYTADGRIISSIGFDQIFKGNNIFLGQILQEEKGVFILKIVPTAQFTVEDEKDIIAKLKKRVGQDSKVILKPVKEIPKAKSGKYNLVVTNIKK